MAINEKTISVRTKRLAKTNKVKIIKSNGCYYLEAIPSEYCDNLSADELNKVYLSFIKLGRNLYHENKEKNISKIKVINGTLNLDIDGTLLRNNPNNYINDEKIEKITQQFNAVLDIKDSLNFSNHSFILLKDNNVASNIKKLKQWLLDNYIPIKEQSDKIDDKAKKYWVYSDDGMLIDMAIFCYLVTYAIINARKKYIGYSIKEDDPDFIQFTDFIDFKDNNESDKLHIGLVNDIIYLYERSNIHSLYGFNKLQYDYDKDEYKIVRQYEDIYGVLWHIFKLYLAENYKIEDNNAKYIPITICEECGSPILGDILRCDDCKYKNQNVRQKKCREEKFAHIEEIRKLINTESFPNYLIKKANKYVKMTNHDIYNCKKKEIDNLLKQLKSHKEKVSKH